MAVAILGLLVEGVLLSGRFWQGRRHYRGGFGEAVYYHSDFGKEVAEAAR